MPSKNPSSSITSVCTRKSSCSAHAPPPSALVTRFVQSCVQLGKPRTARLIRGRAVTVSTPLCIHPHTLQHSTRVCISDRHRFPTRHTQHTILWRFVESPRTNRALFRRLQRAVCPSERLSFGAIRHHFTPEHIHRTIAHKVVVLGGDVQHEQLPAFHRMHPSVKHVVLNASQINFLEQNAPHHDPWCDLEGFYADTTFGPGVVRSQPGGAEFVAWTLRPFLSQSNCKYGALQAFFDAQRRHSVKNSVKSPSVPAGSLHIPHRMGYFTSNLTKTEQDTLAAAFLHSHTRVCGFRWSQPDASAEHETYVYQTGAINSKHSALYPTARSPYHHLHRQAPPSPEFEFGVICAQLFNAMYTESKHAPVVFHTTRLGEGVFGNVQNVSLYALAAAYECLPQQNKNNIRLVTVGGFSKKDQRELSRFWGSVPF
jgi:hypothetical protein